MPCFPLKSWRRGKKTKTAQSTDLSSAGLQWPITVHCGSRHRQWTQDEYQRARVDLTPGELKIVNDWTSKSKQKDWGTAMEEKWKRGREERYGPYEWDNATAMLCDYTYRCVWKRLDEEENCAEHRIVQIKDYARDLWPTKTTVEGVENAYTDATGLVYSATTGPHGTEDQERPSMDSVSVPAITVSVPFS